MKSGIYKITNKINNKFYYGSAVNLEKRFSNHKGRLRNNQHSNRHLQSAWNKYGEDNFMFSIELLCEKNECLFYEQLFLNKYFDGGINCYNICPTAGSQFGIKRSPEVCQKMSDVRKGKMLGNKHRLGIPHTPETLEKMSKSLKGKTPWNKGRTTPEHVRLKMSLAQKGKRKQKKITD